MQETPQSERSRRVEQMMEEDIAAQMAVSMEIDECSPPVPSDDDEVELCHEEMEGGRAPSDEMGMQDDAFHSLEVT